MFNKTSKRLIYTKVLLCIVVLFVVADSKILAIDLSVPYYWQSGTEWCWAAGASMLQKYYILTSDELVPGMQAKPWFWAWYLNKGPDDTANGLEILSVLNAGDPLGMYLFFPITWDIVDVGVISSQLIQGKPVYGAFMDIGGNVGHVIVITGCSGILPTDLVYVNDPSGFLFSKVDGGLCHVSVTWEEFFDAIDQTDWSFDGLYFIPTAPLKLPAGTKASIDLCPSWDLSTTPGITAEIDSDNYAELYWSGKNNHPGYYYSPSNTDLHHPADNVADWVDYGILVTPLDTLKFAPLITNCTDSSVDVSVELSIMKGLTEVIQQSNSFQVSSYGHYSETLFEIPVSNFSKVERGEYTAKLTLKVKGLFGLYYEHDSVKVAFYLTEAPITKGLYWLRAHQAADGSWYNDPAVTSFAVLTMLNWGYTESDPIVAKGINYIRSNIQTDGSVYSNINRYTYYTAIAILPLAATHNTAYHNDISRMRSWLIASQWIENSLYGGIETTDWRYGGWGYGSSSRPDLSNTQWTLMGLKAADKELALDATNTYNKCANYFLASCRQADGGSTYTPEYEDWSIHTMTAASVWSYSLCGRGSGTEALGGINWLTTNYSLTNNDGWGYWSEYYYNVTLAKALTMTHKTMLGAHDWFAELSDKLIGEQDAAGNWPDTGMPSSGEIGSALSTCWAIMALQSRTLPPSGDFGMWASLESHCDVHVYDPQGRHTGVNYLTNTIEENIPGSDFKILDADGNEVPYNGNTPGEGLKQFIDLSHVSAGSYRIELIGTSNGPFHLEVGGTQDGNTVTSQAYDGDIITGQRLATNVTVTSMEGAMTLLYEPLQALPILGVAPVALDVLVEQNAISEFSFTVSEDGNEQTLHGVSFYCNDIDGLEGHIDGATITFVPTNFDILPGGNQLVTGYIPVPADFKGPGNGSIVVESTDGGAKSIALTLITNRPPISNAGSDQTVYAWIDGIAEVNLDGSGSYDEDGDELTYFWTWTIDGNTYDANGVKPSIELPIGQHIITLIVNDGTIDSEPNDVNITVVGPIETNLCVTPKVLNSKSFMPRIMATLRLPKGITKDQIDSNEPILLYPGEIEADWMWISRDFDYKCKAWNTTIFASFDKDELMDAIDDNGQVELVVVGRLKTGQYFFGTDNIRVISPGHWPWHRPWCDYRWNRWCHRPVNCRH